MWDLKSPNSCYSKFKIKETHQFALLVFLPGESQGCGSLVGCRLWGCTVGHDWSDLATAAAAAAGRATYSNMTLTTVRLSLWSRVQFLPIWRDMNKQGHTRASRQIISPVKHPPYRTQKWGQITPSLFSVYWSRLNLLPPTHCSSMRQRQILYDTTYMWNLKNYTYLQNRNRLTDIESKLMVTKGERWGGG